MEHRIVNGLHVIIDKKGHVHVYTEKEYSQLTWFNKLKLRLW